jgi:sugar lactone lactonase YvrE/enterochelin esterase-like enzyme
MIHVVGHRARGAVFLVAAVSALPMQGLAQTQEAGKKTAPPAIQESTAAPFDQYPLGPDSEVHPGVPQGKTFHFDLRNSKVFPNTVRTVTVYVPAQYKGDQPACLFLGLDGLSFNAPTVFDNLIAQGAMPVTIGIGVTGGWVEPARGKDDPRYDRSFEFDSMDDRLARFLLEEAIPAVESHRTPDGLPIKLSTDPNDRAIGGGSTGGIAAFTVAWQRPDAFRRVFTAIGTFVGMRGGEGYYVLVRKTEPKPLRIFMQDGVNDEWTGAEMGDWWMSNQTMNRALEFAGYDVRHVWGAGTHDGGHAFAIFPDAMRWLWRDWPKPIVAGLSGNPSLKAILKSGEGWSVVADGCEGARTLAANAQGKVFYGGAETAAVPAERGAAEPKGAPGRCSSVAGAAFAYGPDGSVYEAAAGGGLQVRSAGGKVTPVWESSVAIQQITVRSNGDAYLTGTARDGKSELWVVPAKGAARRLDGDLKSGTGLAFSPDGLWLLVAQSESRFGMSYRVLPDGGVDSREAFYEMYLGGSADESGAMQVAMDRNGSAYLATGMGVQVFDRNGRVTAILPLPENEPATGVCFGGPDFSTLYVLSGGKIYQRTMAVPGVAPWADAVKLPPWGAG